MFKSFRILFLGLGVVLSLSSCSQKNQFGITHNHRFSAVAQSSGLNSNDEAPVIRTASGEYQLAPMEPDSLPTITYEGIE